MLRVEGVSKRFGSLRALEDVSIEFQPANVHAVLGENGAGKSTLMGVLAGFLRPDSGKVFLGDTELSLGNANECKRFGIEMIHQHFTLVPEFTVAENLALTKLGRLAVPIDPMREAKKAIAIADSLGWQLDPRAKVRGLPVGAQQRLEILKALSGDAKVLIFDEPTAVLSPEEVVELFGVLRRLRDEGKVVVLIAHKLSEVLAVADVVSVLRRGRLVGGGPRSSFDEQGLAALMVGQMPERTKPSLSFEPMEGLSVRDLSVLGDRGEEAVRGATFEVKRGEILGIGGVDGNGQVEMAEALVGVRHGRSGHLEWLGTGIDYGVIKVGYVPQDRQSDGLALPMSIVDNLLVTGHRKLELRLGRAGRRRWLRPFLDLAACRRWAQDLMRRFDVKAQGPSTPVGTLSGGNQQKVVVARALESMPELLVVVNPTRGLDIQATEYVHGAIREARAAMAAVVLFTTDLDELYGLADRTAFMSGGQIVEDTGAAALVGGA